MADRYAGFADFVAARGPALMRTASLLTGDRDHAEDALQEALTKAALKWPSISRDGNPEPYVRQALYTVAIDRWRSMALVARKRHLAIVLWGRCRRSRPQATATSS